MRHLVLHLRQPLAQLLVLLVEDDPGVETIRDLLFTQRHLTQRGLDERNEISSIALRCLVILCLPDLCLIITDAEACFILVFKPTAPKLSQKQHKSGIKVLTSYAK